MFETTCGQIASLVQARLNARESGNITWYDRHEDEINSLVEKYLPSGSGLNSGISIDLVQSTADRLVFHFTFFHVENQSYEKHTDHTLIVTPSLANGFNLEITGEDFDGIKEYLRQTFSDALGYDMERGG